MTIGELQIVNKGGVVRMRIEVNHIDVILDGSYYRVGDGVVTTHDRNTGIEGCNVMVEFLGRICEQPWWVEKRTQRLNL